MRQLVDEIGVDEVDRRFVLRLRNRLEQLANDEFLECPEKDPDDWIEDAVAHGGDLGDLLDPEIRLSLVVAAAEAAADEDELWCIADMPADHLVGDALEMGLRLHQIRSTSKQVDQMFRVMQTYYADMGLDAGWWADESPTPLHP